MTIFLLAKDNSDVNVEQDMKTLNKLLDRIKKVKNGEPVIVTLKGYELFAVPGSIDQITPVKDDDGEEIIKIDFKAFVDSGGIF